MGMAWDLQVIDEDDFKVIQKLENQKLIGIKRECDGNDLIFEFEKHTLKITSQDSENYGFGIFFNLDKTQPTKECKR